MRLRGRGERQEHRRPDDQGRPRSRHHGLAEEAGAAWRAFPDGRLLPLRHAARYVAAVKGHVDAPPPGSRLGDRYTLERVLGSGAMGSVYEVRDASGARLAMKTLLAASGREHQEK